MRSLDEDKAVRTIERRIAKLEMAAAAKPTIPPDEPRCVQCDGGMAHKRAKALYCSPRCRTAAHNKRKVASAAQSEELIHERHG